MSVNPFFDPPPPPPHPPYASVEQFSEPQSSKPQSSKPLCGCCPSKTPEISPPINLFGKEYSSCNAGDGPNDETKKRKFYSNKRDNKLSREQKRQQRQSEARAQAQPNVILSSVEILINQRNACISKGCNKYFLNFFRSTDSPDVFSFDEAIRVFDDLRKSTLGLSKKKMNEECLSLFLLVHHEQYAQGVGIDKWNPDSSRLILRIRDVETSVCTQAFVEAHGFTMSRWKKIAHIARKMSNEGKLGTASQLTKDSEVHKEFKDSTIPNFTLAEATQIFADNVPDYLREMPRTALTPKREADFLCIAWLFKYAI